MITPALPFVLLGLCRAHITAGEMSVLNATSPMWGAVMSRRLLGERLTARRVAGLVLGLAGVALIARPTGAGDVPRSRGGTTCAAACSRVHGGVSAAWAPDAPAKGLAVGTQLAAVLLVSPLRRSRRPAQPTPLIVGSVLALGLICGALAYVLYFRLIADLGATGALTVTYLIPLFAMLWGALLLAEPVTLPMACGAALVMIGTVLVLKQDAARTRAARSAP